MENLNRIFEKAKGRVEEYLMLGCGVIMEKHFITNEEELERVH
jgi:hypothetical protein